MNVLSNPHPRSPEHCGTVSNLRIRTTPSESAQLQALAWRNLRRPHKHRISLYIGEVAASKVPVVLDDLAGVVAVVPARRKRRREEPSLFAGAECYRSTTAGPETATGATIGGGAHRKWERRNKCTSVERR